MMLLFIQCFYLFVVVCLMFAGQDLFTYLLELAVVIGSRKIADKITSML